MSELINILSWVFVLAGSGFVVIGAIGFIRMPDIYTRMHAASVIDTLGAGFLILGMLLQAPTVFVAFKLLVIAALLFFFGPVASHAIAQAALEAGVKPVLKNDRRKSRDGAAATGAGEDGQAASNANAPVDNAAPLPNKAPAELSS